ncbi:S41 family peptidase [Acinetobacter soli]|uniref:S41 family peptidase n=1 Tax=Acinetobacter soli TaxID=487316 RepID=UPI0032B3BBCC
MTQRFNFRVLLTGWLMCCSPLVLSAAPATAQVGEDGQAIRSVEVPVESIQQFVQIYNLVKDNYVESKPDEVLFQQAIKGLVGGLDRYSRYLSPEEYKQLVQYTEGDLASVDFALLYEPRAHQWVIRDLKEGADSYKLGLRNDQIVTKIDGQDLQGLNHEQVHGLLYGSIGTPLQMQTSTMAVAQTLIRNKKIEADVQPVLVHNQVLVLKVRVFQQDTANEIKRLIEEYGSPRLKAVLIDLRNNPGGLLSAAVESADLFLNQGVIVSTKSRSEGNQQFQALPSNEFQRLKLGILINHRSASAAEVFTAAMKEHQRAWVIGEKSYGKGVVQKLFPLPDGAALQMTVSHYYTPKDNMIEGKGIQPNQVYPLPADMKDEIYLENVSEMLLKQAKL